MPERYSLIDVSALTPADIPRAHLLAQMGHASVTVADFRSYVRRLTNSQSSGLLVARSGRRVVLGFAPWWMRPDLRRRSELWSGPIIAAEPAPGGRVHQALAVALENKAAELAESEVRIVLDDEWAGSPLHQLGFQRDGVLLKRAVVRNGVETAS